MRGTLSRWQGIQKAETMESINQRINELVRRVGKQKTFAERCEILPSTLNMIIGKAKVTPETATIEKILAAYPEVNREWLMSGSGPMLNNRAGTELMLFKEEAAEYGITEHHTEDSLVRSVLHPLEEELRRIELKKADIEAKIRKVKNAMD